MTFTRVNFQGSLHPVSISVGRSDTVSVLNWSSSYETYTSPFVIPRP